MIVRRMDKSYVRRCLLGCTVVVAGVISGPALLAMGGGGGGTIDPPIGGLLTDPGPMPDQNPDPNIVEVNLEVKTTPINVNGTTANLMTYNGCFPGPTIHVRRGNRLIVHLINSLPATSDVNILGFQRGFTNLHTHGWHVSPKKPSDYVVYSLAPGDNFTHEYDSSRQSPGTLSFYHPHKHGLVAEQYWAGLVGALVVEDNITALANYETHLLILKDISLSGTDPAPHSMMMDYMNGKEGDTVMVNGQVNPQLVIRPGQIQRWRILNASNARFYKLSLQNHSMYLVGTDGGLLDKPYPLSQILLSPGERADVLVQGRSTPGNNKLLALSYSRMGMGGMGGGGMGSSQVTLMTLTVQGTSAADTLPATVNPQAVRLNPDNLTIAARRTMTLTMGMGRGYINGMDFDVDPYMFMSNVGDYEIWTIVNGSSMDHPFHQHVDPGLVLSVSGADSSYPAYATMPAWKDVVMIPKGGSATILVPVKDYDGMAMFHCHILEHEDIGMMGMWDRMGGTMGTMVQGMANLMNFTGDRTKVPLTVDVRLPGSTTPLVTYTVMPSATGEYSFNTPLTGGHDLAAKGPHWLRQKVAGVNLPADGMAMVDFDLVNGDCDGDNEVTSTDLSCLLANLGSATSQTGFDSADDLDGSGTVDAADTAILMAAMDQRGD